MAVSVVKVEEVETHPLSNNYTFWVEEAVSVVKVEKLNLLKPL
jgi:hypothetical protein